MKRILALVLVLVMALPTALSFAEENAPSVTGKVTEIEKYGHAVLDVTIEAFNGAGFALGDIVTVTAGAFTGDIPYFDGYYVDKGEYMVRAYPGHTCIAVCINYGKFAETAGIGIGDSVTVTLKEKAGALDIQTMSSLVYTNDPADYASEEVFANFRMVTTGEIAEGRLYRSASPINNEHNRASFGNKLIENAGIKSVMNMADTEEEVKGYIAAEDFASGYYKALYDNGSVIVLSMPINFSSPEFAESIVKGFNFLAAQEAPYLIHCTEGKDRAGFASMLIGALMGGTKDELIADYMLSYANYYGITAETDSEKYEMIVSKNIMEMLYVVAGVEKGASLDEVDFAGAAEAYLLNAGMAPEAIEALKANLK